MTYGLQQAVLLAALTTALAAIDPCSEVYPGLNADFATTQTKVSVCTEPFTQITWDRQVYAIKLHSSHYISALSSLC